MSQADEESIRAYLEAKLNAFVDGDRCARWLTDFGAVVRSAKQTSAACSINKQPDLTFRPNIPYPEVVNLTNWGWFVECKIIDASHSLGDYRDQGVRRFSDAEYAAAMGSAAMLGYVRDGQQPKKCLPDLLVGCMGTTNVQAGTILNEVVSVHSRPPSDFGRGPIALTHLWLQSTGDSD